MLIFVLLHWICKKYDIVRKLTINQSIVHPTDNLLFVAVVRVSTVNEDKYRFGKQPKLRYSCKPKS